MFAIIDSPGWHGDIVHVYAVYETIEQARAANRHYCGRIVSGCHKKAGETIYRGPLADLISRGDWKVES